VIDSQTAKTTESGGVRGYWQEDQGQKRYAMGGNRRPIRRGIHDRDGTGRF